jgi:hypothetical protein
MASARAGRWLDAVLVALPPVAIAIQPLANNDLPMHLAVGEWILDHRTLPTRDPFSFTAGHPHWVPHEWLAEIAFAAVERAGGLVGLVALGAALAAALALVHRAAMAELGVGSGAQLLWTLPMWLVAGRRIVLRPHLAALILPFSLWWCLLRARRSPWLLALAPLLLAIWVNLHGSFPLGFGIVALDLVVFGRGHPLAWRTRLLATAACAAAGAAQLHAWFQPSPLAGIRDSLGLLQDPVFMQEISEWKSPLASARFRETYAFLASLPWIALAALGFARQGSALPASYRAFALCALLLYFRHSRFIDLMALASLPFLPGLRGTSARGALRLRRIGRLATVAAALAFLWPGFPMRPGQAFRRPALRWGHDLPIEAVDDLVRRGYEGGVFCEYKFGGVVAWRGRGRLFPSMDSRNSVYGADLYLAHREAMHRDTPLRRELLERVGAVLVLRPTLQRDRRDLIEHLRRAKVWRLVHAGERSLLFVKVRSAGPARPDSSGRADAPATRRTARAARGGRRGSPASGDSRRSRAAGAARGSRRPRRSSRGRGRARAGRSPP